ncbi:hypothetical protein [Krasilnikovia sp. MM14-A1259]|uniref:hypothetical protein n=1 Tax=Krasilnikovia sp. MM14-A1259 TaxID=3373539 RepID=UPI00399D0F39
MSEQTKRRRRGRPPSFTGTPFEGIEPELVQGRVPTPLAQRFKQDADSRGQSDAVRLTEILEAYYRLEAQSA